MRRGSSQITVCIGSCITRELSTWAICLSALADSLSAYRQGDLLNALARYPEGRQPASDPERLYYAAVLLSVGQVDKTLDLLATLGPAGPSERLGRLAGALRQ